VETTSLYRAPVTRPPHVHDRDRVPCEQPQVAPDRRHGDVELAGQLGDADASLPGELLEDCAQAVWLAHLRNTN